MRGPGGHIPAVTVAMGTARPANNGMRPAGGGNYFVQIPVQLIARSDVSSTARHWNKRDAMTDPSRRALFPASQPNFAAVGGYVAASCYIHRFGTS